MGRENPAFVPVFLDVSGQPCLIVGGGRIAERKAQTLMDGGADVTVVSPEASPRLRQCAEAGSLRWRARRYEPGEAAGYFLIIAATDDRGLNEQVSRDGREAGRLVNVVDGPRQSNFITPAVVRRGELQIAISTSGACPAFAGRLREEMEARYPEAYGRLLRRLEVFRASLARSVPDPAERAAVLGRVVRSAEIRRFLDGEEAPLEDLLNQCVS